ncbi:hypothetical protein BESB_036090 [Besnoitia besnoiti]|uniref:protein-serine/threonine phosphatase n=1 Tax=Besnoitia besnoiti TaxID=94643 RepID=A0A2A9MLF1_BESBE|nr:hypothetical protein BESB_036090 [Besnoitia besnoiti]PFH37151.1 hypothetical protein BESB_036090 [Besnoitia besnoiti]
MPAPDGSDQPRARPPLVSRRPSPSSSSSSSAPAAASASASAGSLFVHVPEPSELANLPAQSVDMRKDLATIASEAHDLAVVKEECLARWRQLACESFGGEGTFAYPDFPPVPLSLPFFSAEPVLQLRDSDQQAPSPPAAREPTTRPGLSASLHNVAASPASDVASSRAGEAASGLSAKNAPPQEDATDFSARVVVAAPCLEVIFGSATRKGTAHDNEDRLSIAYWGGVSERLLRLPSLSLPSSSHAAAPAAGNRQLSVPPARDADAGEGARREAADAHAGAAAPPPDDEAYRSRSASEGPAVGAQGSAGSASGRRRAGAAGSLCGPSSSLQTGMQGVGASLNSTSTSNDDDDDAETQERTVSEVVRVFSASSRRRPLVGVPVPRTTPVDEGDAELESELALLQMSSVSPAYRAEEEARLRRAYAQRKKEREADACLQEMVLAHEAHGHRRRWPKPSASSLLFHHCGGASGRRAEEVEGGSHESRSASPFLCFITPHGRVLPQKLPAKRAGSDLLMEMPFVAAKKTRSCHAAALMESNFWHDRGKKRVQGWGYTSHAPLDVAVGSEAGTENTSPSGASSVAQTNARKPGEGKAHAAPETDEHNSARQRRSSLFGRRWSSGNGHFGAKGHQGKEKAEGKRGGEPGEDESARGSHADGENARAKTPSAGSQHDSENEGMFTLMRRPSSLFLRRRRKRKDSQKAKDDAHEQTSASRPQGGEGPACGEHGQAQAAPATGTAVALKREAPAIPLTLRNAPTFLFTICDGHDGPSAAVFAALELPKLLCCRTGRERVGKKADPRGGRGETEAAGKKGGDSPLWRQIVSRGSSALSRKQTLLQKGGCRAFDSGGSRDDQRDTLFKDAFHELDSNFRRQCHHASVRTGRACTSGACVLSVLVRGNELISQNVGDCRAALLTIDLEAGAHMYRGALRCGGSFTPDDVLEVRGVGDLLRSQVSSSEEEEADSEPGEEGTGSANANRCEDARPQNTRDFDAATVKREGGGAPTADRVPCVEPRRGGDAGGGTAGNGFAFSAPPRGDDEAKVRVDDKREEDDGQHALLTSPGRGLTRIAYPLDVASTGNGRVSHSSSFSSFPSRPGSLSSLSLAIDWVSSAPEEFEADEIPTETETSSSAPPSGDSQAGDSNSFARGASMAASALSSNSSTADTATLPFAARSPSISIGARLRAGERADSHPTFSCLSSSSSSLASFSPPSSSSSSAPAAGARTALSSGGDEVTGSMPAPSALSPGAAAGSSGSGVTASVKKPAKRMVKVSKYRLRHPYQERALMLQYLNTEHRCSDPRELARIRRAGGSILGGRVGGILEPARTIGDFDVKDAQPFGVLTATPDVARVRIRKPSLLLLGTDGIWDTLLPSDILACMQKIPQLWQLILEAFRDRMDEKARAVEARRRQSDPETGGAAAPAAASAKSTTPLTGQALREMQRRRREELEEEEATYQAERRQKLTKPQRLEKGIKADMLSRLCEELIKAARRRGSEDDATCLAVFLNPASPAAQPEETPTSPVSDAADAHTCLPTMFSGERGAKTK